MKSLFVYVWLLVVGVATTITSSAAAAAGDLCPPTGQTPNLAGVAGQFVFVRHKNGCPQPEEYDSTHVSEACRTAQKALYQNNPALQAAMETYVQGVQKPVMAAFDDKQKDHVNFNAANIPGHAAFKAQCQKTKGALVHHVEQNLSCGNRDYHFQLRNDLACVAIECKEAERNVDNIAVMKLLVSQSEGKLGGTTEGGTCGGGFADYVGYTWYMYLPVALWVVATGGCLLLAQKQKNLYAYSVVSTSAS